MAKTPAPFVGRERELHVLADELDQVRSSGQGRFVLIRGRRQVGKTRTAEEFVSSEKTPHVFFAATKGRTADAEVGSFAEAVAASTLPTASVLRAGGGFDTWIGGLALIGQTAEPESPSIVVVDELPYLIERDASVEGALQTAWDRHLRRKPVLLIVIGSDLAMMELLSQYGRPLFGRPSREIHLRPLSPGEIARMLGLQAAAAFDGYLVVGGFPLLALNWGRARDLRQYLRRELPDPTSPLVVAGERMVSEFPPEAQARAVLSAVGSGETTFTAIGSASGLPRQSLERALSLLVEKRVVEKISPLSARPSRLTRYFVSDPYMRFWLRFIERGFEEIQRGRGDLVAERIIQTWADYRGVAIEPLVRLGVEATLPSREFGAAKHVGAYWTRDGQVQVDLVGVANRTKPNRVEFIGSIKWRERSPFSDRDLAAMVAMRGRVPGTTAETPLVGVSRAGFSTSGLQAAMDPVSLLVAG